MNLALESLGLIAGNRSLPFEIARLARAAGVNRIVCVAFENETDPALAKLVDDKSRTDRTTALENTVKSIANGSIEDVQNVKRTLLTGGDAEFERELAETFVASGDQCLAEIMAALKVRDFDTVRKRVHSLKGASANIHARELSQTASSLETAARENSMPAIGGLVDELKIRLAAVNAELRRAG